MPQIVPEFWKWLGRSFPIDNQGESEQGEQYPKHQFSKFCVKLNGQTPESYQSNQFCQ
jgi:hypothetical protein